MRGAERTFAEIAECWPDATIYTLLYDRAGTSSRFSGRRVETSYLQSLRVRQSGFRRLLPLFPRAVERLPVGDHDLVVSSSSAFAHGVRPGPGAVHVCYCHSPFRYVWHEKARGLAEAPRALRPVLREVLERLSRWDLAASRRVTHYIANSELTRQRIGDYYGREAEVVHPPVDTGRFKTLAPEEFFLVVAELVPHKRVELALEAARRAGRRLKVVGDGPQAPRLAAAYGDSTDFLGRIGDGELAGLLARAQALVVPNVEEFGIAAVEAQAAGRPVVAPGAGGAVETVVPGETGVLVAPGDVDALAEALRYTDFAAFSPERTRRNAERFSKDSFRKRLTATVDRLAAQGR